MLIKNAKIITPANPIHYGWIHSQDSKITGIGTDDAPDDDHIIDAKGRFVLPGFIDLHVHGGKGHEAMDATPEALEHMAQFYAAHGVTAFLATTWTDSRTRIQAALETIAAKVGPQTNGATLLGAHLEGPYLNPAKCGAQNIDHIRRAHHDEAMGFLNLNVIKLAAIAPEYEENHWFIQECVERGITVSVAHTNATYNDIVHAVKLGLTQSTHTYNAMTGLHHREPGVVGAVLTMPEIKCELIADNIHVHPAAMNVLYKAKGPDHVILITDAVRPAGMPDGAYTIDERTIFVKDGAIRLESGSLAGSTLTMDRALHNFMQATDEPLTALWRTSSLNAARAIGIDADKGSLEIGKDADMVIVDEDITVHVTVANGKIIYER